MAASVSVRSRQIIGASQTGVMVDGKSSRYHRGHRGFDFQSNRIENPCSTLVLDDQGHLNSVGPRPRLRLDDWTGVCVCVCVCVCLRGMDLLGPTMTDSIYQFFSLFSCTINHHMPIDISSTSPSNPSQQSK
jgi:hypothetical protein